MENNKENKTRTNYTKFYVIGVVVIVLLNMIASPIMRAVAGKDGRGNDRLKDLSEVGNLMAISNALFAGLAFIGLIQSIRQNKTSIEIQTDALRLQNEELKNQREELKATRNQMLFSRYSELAFHYLNEHKSALLNFDEKGVQRFIKLNEEHNKIIVATHKNLFSIRSLIGAIKEIKGKTTLLINTLYETKRKYYILLENSGLIEKDIKMLKNMYMVNTDDKEVIEFLKNLRLTFLYIPTLENETTELYTSIAKCLNSTEQKKFISNIEDIRQLMDETSEKIDFLYPP